MCAADKNSKKSSKHPRAGETMTGAEMVIQVLADEGTDTIFGYSGGAILPTYDAIFRHNQKADPTAGGPIRLIVPANEQGAGFMAAGYSRASGRMGVALVTSGPGATNTVTPVRDAMADSVPFILITGQVPRAAIGSDAFQEAPVFNIMSSCAKHCFLVKNPDELEATVRTAFFIARTGRPGPVVLDLPKDIQNWSGVFKGEGMLPLRGYRQRLAAIARSRVTDAQSRSLFNTLAKSRRPLLYVGGGVINSNAAKELTEFANYFKIPVVTTLMGIGAYDTTSERSLHMLGMHGTAFANYAVEDCDFIFSIGARFDDRVAGRPKDFAPQARAIAHLDIDASEINKVKSVHWHHVGDAAAALSDLLAAAKKLNFKPDYSQWVKHCVELKRKYPMDYDRKSKFIQPYDVIERLNKLTKGEAIIATGVGQHQMWAAQYFDYKNPRTFLTSGSMGTMGYGLPAAIGAQVACPGKIVVDIDGDGSIRMNLGELETLTTYNVPVKVLLLNNLGDGMVRQWQKMYFGDRFAGTDKSLHKKDFIKAVEADGFGFARRVTDVKKLDDALKAFVEYDGPAFLEVMIDQDAGVFPMVGPGMSYAEMVTGPAIKSRPKEEAPAPALAGVGAGPVDLSKTPDLF